MESGRPVFRRFRLRLHLRAPMSSEQQVAQTGAMPKSSSQSGHAKHATYAQGLSIPMRCDDETSVHAPLPTTCGNTLKLGT